MKVGLAGLAGAGKDTFAVMLQEELSKLGHSFVIDRYAGLLKEAARQVFGETFDDRDVKEELVFVTPDLLDRMVDSCDYLQLVLNLRGDVGLHWWDLFDIHLGGLTWISPRLFQQLVGTELGRSIDENIWVNYLKNKSGNLIVPDVRFENELLDLNILIKRWLPHIKPEHPSEHFAYDLSVNIAKCAPDIGMHFIVFNQTSVKDLRVQAKACAEYIINKL